MTDSPLHTETVDVSSGSDHLRGFLASRTPDVRGPVIVLIPDVHGLSDFYRGLATRFANGGVSALAVDLYAREGAPTLRDAAEAMRWIASLPDDRVLGDLQAAVDWLHRERRASAVGITGFCMGGQYALLAACTLGGLGACVSFYGMLRYAKRNERKPRSPLDAAADLTCPYLGLFGAQDALIPVRDVAELQERLSAARKTFELQSYPGCGHAFLNETRPDAYRPAAAADAFDRAVTFFHKHLAPASA